jgi:hypothetical protein
MSTSAKLAFIGVPVLGATLAACGTASGSPGAAGAPSGSSTSAHIPSFNCKGTSYRSFYIAEVEKALHNGGPEDANLRGWIRQQPPTSGTRLDRDNESALIEQEVMLYAIDDANPHASQPEIDLATSRVEKCIAQEYPDTAKEHFQNGPLPPGSQPASTPTSSGSSQAVPRSNYPYQNNVATNPSTSLTDPAYPGNVFHIHIPLPGFG